MLFVNVTDKNPHLPGVIGMSNLLKVSVRQIDTDDGHSFLIM